MIMENEENSKYLANLQQQETQMKEEMKIQDHQLKTVEFKESQK